MVQIQCLSTISGINTAKGLNPDHAEPKMETSRTPHRTNSAPKADLRDGLSCRRITLNKNVNKVIDPRTGERRLAGTMLTPESQRIHPTA